MPKTDFEALRDYAEMRAKADYMNQFGVETVADMARTLAMFGAFTAWLVCQLRPAVQFSPTQQHERRGADCQLADA
jgi:hypothetical protein